MESVVAMANSVWSIIDLSTPCLSTKSDCCSKFGSSGYSSALSPGMVNSEAPPRMVARSRSSERMLTVCAGMRRMMSSSSLADRISWPGCSVLASMVVTMPSSRS